MSLTRTSLALTTILLVAATVLGAAAKLPYLDPDQPLERRVQDLLSRMTLEEKVGQLNISWFNALGKDYEEKLEACRRFSAGSLLEEIGPAGGFFGLPTMLPDGPSQQSAFTNELQKIAAERTRLQIPLIIVEEGTHGFRATGGTVFPEGLAIGSTWNMDLVERLYTVAAKEARATGTHFLATLVVEPIRDPRLGRNEEAYSEDPYLCSQIAKAIVAGTQGQDVSAPDKVAALLCHYPGQSQPVSGLERGAMEISERTLRDVFLPPWVAGIKEAGALGVMATYPAIDGVPAHASYELLTKLLREELDFQGIVVSEGSGFYTLLYEGIVATQKEAGRLAIDAGLDVSIWFEDAYLAPLLENIREGKVSMDVVDRSVERVLRMKFLLGLFDNRYSDPDYATRIVNTTEHQELALEVAREGIVLLKNENDLLPLDKSIEKIAVIGPNADHNRNQLGDYITRIISQDVVTVLDGIEAKVSPNTKVSYVQGCDILKEDINQIEEAKAAARDADVAVVVLGESRRTDGEGSDVATLELTGLQQDLVKAVVETDTPTIVVLINGRPLATGWVAEHASAILEAWMCGEKGGTAVADVLFGDYNPSGRLPITVPRHVGQLPVYYNYKPSKFHWIKEGWGNAYRDLPAQPLYPFGFGLSYTDFEYTDLRINPAESGPAGGFSVSVDVKNTGRRSGHEVVQLYVNDVLSSVTTPVKELKGFQKIQLEPGQLKTVEFTVLPSQLSLLDRNLNRVVEPGTFQVMVGSSSEDIRREGSFVVSD